MKEMGAYLGLPIFLLVSVWGALSTVVEMTEKLNRMRNSALGLSESDRAVPLDLRYEIFKNDWIGLWLCVIAALIVLAAIFLLIPALFKAMHKQSKGEVAVWARALMEPVRFGFTHLEIACYGIGFLAFAACVAMLCAGLSDLALVRNRALPQTVEKSSPFLEGSKYEAIINGVADARVFKVAEVRGGEWIKAEIEGGTYPANLIWLSAHNLVQVREFQ
jgi:hypothetical protein